MKESDQLLHNMKVAPEQIRGATAGIKVKILIEIVWNRKLNAFSNSRETSFLTLKLLSSQLKLLNN